MTLRFGSLALCWLLASVAAAEAPSDIAAAMGLSAADGSVRTQTSVRVSLSPLPGSDAVVAMSSAVHPRMPAVRQCFAQSIARSGGREGRIVVNLEKDGARTKAKLTSNQTGDALLGTCVRDGLASADLRAIRSHRAGAAVTVDFSNPAARFRPSLREASVAVEPLAGGRVRSQGGTQNGEVRFVIEASAYDRPGLESLHRDLQSRLAGLLDCRRRAGKRWRSAEGSLSTTVSVNAGGSAQARVHRSTVADRGAAQCVATWVGKPSPNKLLPVIAEVQLSFSR